jgi:hypothetical protein
MVLKNRKNHCKRTILTAGVTAGVLYSRFHEPLQTLEKKNIAKSDFLAISFV